MKKSFKNTTENVQEFYVKGMHCASCEMLIEDKLSEIDGVNKVNAILSENKVSIDSKKKLDPKYLSSFVSEYGYLISDKKFKRDKNLKELVIAFSIALSVLLMFLILQKLGIVNLVGVDNITLPMIFFIGIIASLSTCMAVVGGLVLTISSSYSKVRNYRALTFFHISRLVTFFILGGVIGSIGSNFILTSNISFILSLIIFILMIVLGINLLNIFPRFNRLQLHTPKFLTRATLNNLDLKSVLAPIIIGAVTFILPCGFTQAMQVYTLSSGSFINGALIMLVFALGTLPVLSLISFASVKLSNTLNSSLFFKTSGFIVIFFAIFNLITSLIAIGVLPPFINL